MADDAMPDRIRIIKYELFRSKYGSFEGSLCRWPGIQVFHFDDVPSRRLRPETLTREQELEQARAFARAERQGDMSMKFTADRPYSDPEKAARKLLEIANAAEAEQDGRIPIEKINAPFLFRERATPAEYSAGLAYAIEQGWLVRHESGTFVRFTQAGADLFA